MQDIYKNSRLEWLAEVQDEFLRERFWDKAFTILAIAGMAIAIVTIYSLGLTID